MPRRPDYPQVIGVVLTAALYGASLFLPAFTFTFDIVEVVSGWEALTVPARIWWGVFTEGITQGNLLGKAAGMLGAWGISLWTQIAVAWAPNPLLLLAAVFLLTGRRRPTLVTSSLAVLLGLFVPLRYTIAGDDASNFVFSGYWLWLASLGLPAVFSQVRAGPAAYPVRPA